MADSPSPPTKTIEEKRKSSIFRRSIKSRNLEGKFDCDGVKDDNLQDKIIYKSKLSFKRKNEKSSFLKEEESSQLLNFPTSNDFSSAENNTDHLDHHLAETQNTGEEKKSRKKSIIKRIKEYKKSVKDHPKEENEEVTPTINKEVQNEIVFNKLAIETVKLSRSNDVGLKFDENLLTGSNLSPDCSEDSFHDALQKVGEDHSLEKSVNNEIETENIDIKLENELARRKSQLPFDEFNLSTMSELTTITLTQTDIVTTEIEQTEDVEVTSEKVANVEHLEKNDVCRSDNLLNDASPTTNGRKTEDAKENTFSQNSFTDELKTKDSHVLNEHKDGAFNITCESITLTPIKSRVLNYVVVDKPPEGSHGDESFFAKKALKVYQKANLSRAYCQTCCSVM